jgi:hypothetical protein
MQTAVLAIEQAVQDDIGGRGMGVLVEPGQLYAVASALLQPHVQSVAIVTGFPCVSQHSPPTETDGFPGAMAIAHALRHCGVSPVIVTDSTSASVMHAAVKASSSSSTSTSTPLPDFETVVVDAGVSSDHFNASVAPGILSRVQHVLAIERSGPASDGHCYTMSGRNIDKDCAPLEGLFDEKLLSDAAATAVLPFQMSTSGIDARTF